MVDLFRGELVEDPARAWIAGDLRRVAVELAPAALGDDRNPERIAGEDQIDRHGRRCGRTARAAVFTSPVDLQHALTRLEVPGRRHFLDETLDVGAEEFERLSARLADEMEMARVAVGVLVAK